jgi:hypothetical protein
MNEGLAAARSELSQVQAGLEQQHQAELTRRLAALDSFARWAQTQQLIDAATRPLPARISTAGLLPADSKKSAPFGRRWDQRPTLEPDAWQGGLFPGRNTEGDVA